MYISSGELEKYGYCPLNWYLYIKGRDASGGKVEKGIKTHRKIGERIEKIMDEQKKVTESETIVLWFAVASTVMSLVGASILPYKFSDLFARLLGIIALIWLLAATYLLYRAEKTKSMEETPKYETTIMIFSMIATIIIIVALAMSLITDPFLAMTLHIFALIWLIGATIFFNYAVRKSYNLAESKKEIGIDDSDVVYRDDEKDADLLVHEKYKLRGRPDIILTIDDMFIPVEIKTGRTPQGPLFSHILQLGSYCILVEENYSRKPEYGIIKYPERDFKIKYTDELKNLVLEKLDEMRMAYKTGEVHRNHRRVGKCLHCSRRSECPEKLS